MSHAIEAGRGESIVSPLFAVEARWVDLIFAAIFPEPPRGPFPLAITSLEPAKFYARLCRDARWDHALTLRAALFVTAVLAPLMVLGRFRTLGGLDVETRERVLEGMHTSGHYLFRQLVFLLKSQAAQVFAARPVIRAMVTGDASAKREELVPLRRSAGLEKQRLTSKEGHESAA
jgi:hypothetical protein